MKLSAVILIVFAVLVVDSQAQRFNRIDDRFRADEEEEEPPTDSSQLPIPIITEKASAAIAKVSDMLAAALQAAVANEVFDQSGSLTTIRTMLSDTNTMVNTLFTKVSGAITLRLTRAADAADPLMDLTMAVATATTAITDQLTALKKKVKPSELSAIKDAYDDFTTRVSSLSTFKPKARASFGFLFDQRAADDSIAQGLDLQTVISDWGTAIEGIATSLQALVKVMQTSITSRTLAITVQKSTQKSLSASGSYLSMVSTQLNTALETIRSTLSTSSQKTLSDIQKSFASVPSNPTKWNQSLLSKLFELVAAYSGFLQQDYLTTIAASVRTAEIAIATGIITQARTSGMLITQTVISISDTASASDNPRASSECSLKQLAKLNPSVLNSLAQCANAEANNIKAVSTSGTQQLTMAKDNAVSIVDQLAVCKSATDKCYKPFVDVVDGMKTTAESDLMAAGKQVDTTLTAITKRITDCLKNTADDITTSTTKIMKDFTSCMKF